MLWTNHLRCMICTFIKPFWSEAIPFSSFDLRQLTSHLKLNVRTGKKKDISIKLGNRKVVRVQLDVFYAEEVFLHTAIFVKYLNLSK